MSMLSQAPVPADYANKAWKVDVEGCTYMVAFDDRSIRTDLMQCGDKVAFNRYNTVASATEFGLRFTSVEIAQTSCKARAKQAAVTNAFYGVKGADGSLSVRTNKQPLPYSSFDYDQFETLVKSAPSDGTACVY
jgi:hypothetical protein